MRIFLAGATGAVGKPLVRQLIARGHDVTATTRSAAKAEALRQLGVTAVIIDGLDGAAVGEAVARAEPDAIIHQMTGVSGKPDFKNFDRWFAPTNALRTVGTDNLLAAARAVGVKRFVAQSYTGWNNIREGGPAKSEDDPLDTSPPKALTETLAAIQHLERSVTDAPLDGIVLRYGNFYGPGASEELVRMVQGRMMPILGGGTGIWSWIHVDDAAAAAVVALERGSPGLYNIVDDQPAAVSEWLPYLAEVVGAKPPLRLPVWLGRLVVGEMLVRWMTEARGASNAKAKRELSLELAWPTWRDGFRHGLVGQEPVASPQFRAVA
ncbi:NAD-dependent epimerase/dehydratase family protein [Chelativorans salis]|uniref:NAD(P)-dependent oxidoreductase n=1 Tax=Chelativorans salis TaxID=2978478 RepID=A0ABT2LU55_9HYPH|nr:NAD(P)-dependent oxidoreductase [Chelativorans sp. EGI FJ00035]MCT7378070.1 NAD(P)-dependent oxidoreductase [Chelativorans sp. EGI FJ00035]